MTKEIGRRRVGIVRKGEISRIRGVHFCSHAANSDEINGRTGCADQPLHGRDVEVTCVRAVDDQFHGVHSIAGRSVHGEGVGIDQGTR